MYWKIFSRFWCGKEGGSFMIDSGVAMFNEGIAVHHSRYLHLMFLMETGNTFVLHS